MPEDSSNADASERALPLHVQVAQALGCDVRTNRQGRLGHMEVWYCGCRADEEGFKPHARNFRPAAWELVRFDTDWAATGPLIERYQLCLWTAGSIGRLLGADQDRWRCNSEDNGPQLEGSEVGPTPLIAACRTILALEAAGKLEEAN